ncbi:MAG: hypothetical protein ACKVJG_15635, partial [Candidatus Latescibacterota bacterium]
DYPRNKQLHKRFDRPERVAHRPAGTMGSLLQATSMTKANPYAVSSTGIWWSTLTTFFSSQVTLA